ncbi:MAG: flavin reductase [Chloroflexota bacterium]|nr:flavin reductase [Chloroflexota bacterium]
METQTEIKFNAQVLPASIDPTLFRHVMRKFPTGVAVLTVRDGERIHGMTANAFTSVSLSPTLVLVCIEKGNTTHAFVTRAGAFALNFLSDAQEYLAKRFAKQVAVPAAPFADIAFHAAATGAPIFDDCTAYVDCRVVAAHAAGDHTIFVGEVKDAGYGSARDRAALLWLDGKYISLPHE